MARVQLIEIWYLAKIVASSTRRNARCCERPGLCVGEYRNRILLGGVIEYLTVVQVWFVAFLVSDVLVSLAGECDNPNPKKTPLLTVLLLSMGIQ